MQFLFFSMFGSIWKRSSKNTKWVKEKRKSNVAMWFNKKKKTISEVLEFSILSWTQNQKTDLKDWPLSLRFSLRRKNVNFRGFQIFDFALYLKSETGKPQKVFIYFSFLSFLLHQTWERLKPFNDFQMNTHLMPSCLTSNK